MKLVIVRHATAIGKDAGIPDEQRYLTPEGRAYFRRTARTMAEKGTHPDIIVSSPLVRGVQTADVLAEALQYGGPLVVTERLSPGFSPSGLRALLRDFREARELVIVGHEPDLSGVVASLLSLRNGFSFKKGSAFRLTIDDDLAKPARFKWLAAGKKLILSEKEALAQ